MLFIFSFYMPFVKNFVGTIVPHAISGLALGKTQIILETENDMNL